MERLFHFKKSNNKKVNGGLIKIRNNILSKKPLMIEALTKLNIPIKKNSKEEQERLEREGK